MSGRPSATNPAGVIGGADVEQALNVRVPRETPRACLSVANGDRLHSQEDSGTRRFDDLIRRFGIGLWQMVQGTVGGAAAACAVDGEGLLPRATDVKTDQSSMVGHAAKAMAIGIRIVPEGSRSRVIAPHSKRNRGAR